MRTPLVCIAVAISIAVVVHNVTAQTQTTGPENSKEIYRVIERIEIEKLGLDGNLPAGRSDTKALERGLNLLAADGWELIAAEGGRMRTFHGGGDAVLEIPPSYIFRRSGKGR